MVRNFFVLLVFISPVFLYAQKKDKQLEKLANSITADDMKKHLFIIASKEMEGRDTPSPGLEKAANYIENHFKSLGLLPGNKGSYRQHYPLYRDSVLSTTFKVNGKAYDLNKDFQPQAANYTGEMRFSEIVFAGYGIIDSTIRNDYKDLQVTGKLVMVLDGSPADYKPSSQQGFRSPASSSGKMNAAMSKGAAALMIVHSNFPRSTFNRTSNWSMNSFRATQPLFTFNISSSIAAEILGVTAENIFEKLKLKTPSVKAFPSEIELGFSKSTKTTFVSNVMGLVEGTDKKDEYIVLSAHYDHIGKRNDTTIFYGADDDGSGTTGILEMAEVFAKAKKEGKGPRRSILFLTVSGEEKGLWGSRYYSENPVYPLEKTTVNLNIDMIGRIGTEYMKDKDSANYIYIIGDDKISSDLTPITNKVNTAYSRLKLDRKYNDPNDPNRFYFRSDHYNFAQKGVPIIFYFNGVHADYHRATDTPDKINYPLMAKRARMVFFTAIEIANKQEMLKRDIPLEVPRGF